MMMMKFLKVLIVCLLIKCDSDIQSVSLKANNIQTYMAVMEESTFLFASSCMSTCGYGQAPWTCELSSLFNSFNPFPIILQFSFHYFKS